MEDEITITPIIEHRFDALAGYCRQPSLIPYEELEWYKAQSERLLAVLFIEYQDNQFGGIVVGKDGNGRYRWVGGTAFFDDKDEARRALMNELVDQSAEADASFVQGDEKRRATKILDPVVPEERQTPHFKKLISAEEYSPARGLIEALSPFFRDLDGNFIEQFQTTAFDARVFELYLFAMLHELDYHLDEAESVPDFHCLNLGADFFIEAVTVNPTPGVDDRLTLPVDREEAVAILESRPAIKFGSALFSKLRKEYWKLPHVAGKPLALAVQNFSAELAMMTTSTSLVSYLYGWRHLSSRDEAGHLVITPERIAEHRYEDKVIPSGFFFLPGAENISAVLFNPHATLPKFNRMGVLAQFGSERVQMMRRIALKDHDPDASEPRFIVSDVRDANYFESWTEGLSVYHNPRARFPIEMSWFENSAHHFLNDEGFIVSYVPEYFPMGGATIIIKCSDSDEVEP